MDRHVTIKNVFKNKKGIKKILTATSTKSFGRLIFKREPEKEAPSNERAAEASSGVRNSTKA